MELRKDPITRSWVICGDEPEPTPAGSSLCPFCPESGLPLQVIATTPTVNGGPWSARAVVHPHPLYGIEGEPARSGNGLYDKMHPVGAHEVVVENRATIASYGTPTTAKSRSTWRCAASAFRT